MKISGTCKAVWQQSMYWRRLAKQVWQRLLYIAALLFNVLFDSVLYRLVKTCASFITRHTG